MSSAKRAVVGATGYGAVWRNSQAAFWGGMWAKHSDSPMTQAVLAEAEQYPGLIEVGCGAGHMLQALLGRGWDGTYQGFDIGDSAITLAIKLFQCRAGTFFMCGDFMEWAARGEVMQADLAIARGVVQHHAHWAPLALAMLRFAPRVALGVGYVTKAVDRHVGGYKRKGCYDVSISLELLEVEAAAMGLSAHVTRFTRRRLPEALVVLERKR